MTSGHHSRREFLKGSGALVVSFSIAGSAGALVGQTTAVQFLPGPADQLDSWIAIDESGLVTAYTGKCELGQGLKTAQLQLVAEELGVDVADVTLIQCDTDQTPDQDTTSGSQSHSTNFNNRNLAQGRNRSGSVGPSRIATTWCADCSARGEERRDCRWQRTIAAGRIRRAGRRQTIRTDP